MKYRCFPLPHSLLTLYSLSSTGTKLHDERLMQDYIYTVVLRCGWKAYNIIAGMDSLTQSQTLLKVKTLSCTAVTNASYVSDKLTFPKYNICVVGLLGLLTIILLISYTSYWQPKCDKQLPKLKCLKHSTFHLVFANPLQRLKDLQFSKIHL